MKNFVFIFCVLTTFLCMSCSDDDYEINTKNIVGHWQAVSMKSYIVNNSTGEKKDYGEGPCDIIFKFYDDGTCVRDKILGTYKLIGKELDMFLSYYNDIVGGLSWTENYTIDELSPNKMILTNIEGAQSYTTHYKTYIMNRVN